MTFVDRIKNAIAAFRIKQAPVGMIGGVHMRPSFGGMSVRSMMDSYQGWVYKCIQFRAREVANAKYTVNRISDEGKQTEQPKHVINRILAKPNEFEPGYFLMQRAHTHLDLTGNAYLLIVRNRLNLPAEIWLLDPKGIRIVPDKEMVIKHYEYRIGEKKYVLEPRDVLHVKYPNPNDFFYGLSPVAACALEYDIDLTSKQYQATTFRNAGIPPRYYLTTESTLSSDVVTALKNELVSEYSIDGNRTPMVLQGGTSMKSLSLSPAELDFLNSRKMTRDDICTIFGVPVSIFGITEDVNRANGQTNAYNVTRFTIQPLIDLWASWLTYEFARQYGDSIIITGENVVVADREQEREDMKARLESGVTTINEERQRNGMAPVKGGEEPHVLNTRVRLSQVGTQIQGQKGLEYDERAASVYWQRVDNVANRSERRIQKKIKAYFVELGTEIMKNALPIINVIGKSKQFSDDILLPDKAQWDALIEELGLDEIVEAMKSGWEFGRKEIKGTIRYDLTRETVRNQMRNSLAHIRDINQTTLDMLTDSLERGVDLNESADKLKQRVLDVFREASSTRARTIARTTSTQATNAGMRESWKRETDLVKKQVWISSRDARVRDGHLTADGQEVGMSDPFVVNGESLYYPGDPGGSAGNVINCRCFIAPKAN